MTDSGYVKFVAKEDENTGVTVQLGEDAVFITGGRGGWREDARRKRDPVTTWQGAPLARMDVPVWIDHWMNRRLKPSVQEKVNTLESLARRPSGATQPRAVLVDGAIDGTDREWVIDDITWSTADELRDPDTDALLRRAGVIHLAEYNPGSVLIPERLVGKPTSYHHHKIRAGETLEQIARKRLGKKASSKDVHKLIARIVAINKITGMPRKWLAKHAGKVLLVP